MSIKKKALCLALAASIAGASVGGCYGSYALFNKVHQFNGSIGDKWIASLVHWVLWIIPVYGISLFVDFLILNTIEFWVGSNPVAMGDTYEEVAEDGSKVYAMKNADGSLSVTLTDADGNVADITMVRDDNGEVRILDAAGAAVAFHRPLQLD